MATFAWYQLPSFPVPVCQPGRNRHQVRRYHERTPRGRLFRRGRPVRNGRVETTNLPWVIEAKRLAGELHLKEALLINDLEASAWGIALLDAGDFISMNNVKDTHR